MYLKLSHHNNNNMSKKQVSSKQLKDLFYTQIIDHVEGISSLSLTSNIESVLLEQSKKSLGNKCSKYGYIMEDTIRILQRSIGKIKSSHFDGTVVYNLKLEVTVCNPAEGDIVECVVVGKNKMGILAKQDPLIIALSQLHHNDLSIFSNINVNQTIYVSVVDSKFSLNDKNIQVIGKIYNLT